MNAILRPIAVAAFLLFAALLPAAAADQSLPSGPSAQERQAIEQVVHDYLLRHPKFVVELLKAAEDQMQQEADEETRQEIAKRHDELVADAATPAGGNPEGDVTIVEFFDYRCPYCKMVEPALQALLHDDPKLRIVYKEFPVLGPESIYASRAALAARRQGKYDRFHAAMMGMKGEITDAAVLKVAASVGLDMARLKSDMASAEIDALIQRNYALARALDIHGTPAFIVGDVVAPGAPDIEALKGLIATARKSG